MTDPSADTYQCFIKENFRPLKIKEGGNVRMGRLTYNWLLEQDNKRGLSHLTREKMDKLVQRHGLKVVEFDDGCEYVVNLKVERRVMVEFYQRKEAEEGLHEQHRLSDDVPMSEDELLESYAITNNAIEALTGDRAEDIDMDPDSAVDFISADMVEQGMDQGQVRIFVEEGKFTIITADEETPESEVFALHVTRPLPGTEVPLSKLDLKKRTIITGAYRDQVGKGGHDFEHVITRMDS